MFSSHRRWPRWTGPPSSGGRWSNSSRQRRGPTMSHLWKISVFVVYHQIFEFLILSIKNLKHSKGLTFTSVSVEVDGAPAPVASAMHTRDQRDFFVVKLEGEGFARGQQVKVGARTVGMCAIPSSKNKCLCRSPSSTVGGWARSRRARAFTCPTPTTRGRGRKESTWRRE